MFSISKNYQFYIGTKIILGTGSILNISDEVKLLKGSNLLIVTDKGIISSNVWESVSSVLEKNYLNYSVFDLVQPNPDIETIEKGLAELKKNSCNIIVGIGGGSSMDAARGIALVATNGGNILDYEGRDKFTKPPIPVISIPTTVGTGSEVSRGIVITDHKRNLKMVISGMNLGSKVAILDPKLLTEIPNFLTATTGIDALTHAIEGYTSWGSSPITDALNLYAIKLIAENIRSGYANSSNLEAMGNLLVASTITGMGFTNSRLGLVHSLVHPLGGYYNVAHGLACSVLLPVIMSYNWLGNPKKFCNIAKAMGENLNNCSVEEGAKKAVTAVFNLVSDLNLPKKLSDIGVDERFLEKVALDASKDGSIVFNARKASYNDLIFLLKSTL